jgi:hypothetical protein
MEFPVGLRISGVARDESLDKLLELKLLGYDTVKWKSWPESKDPVTQSLDGQEWSLEDFISNLRYAAPVYEHGHVQDKSSLVVSGPGLAEVEIRAWNF